VVGAAAAAANFDGGGDGGGVGGRRRRGRGGVGASGVAAGGGVGDRGGGGGGGRSGGGSVADPHGRAALGEGGPPPCACEGWPGDGEPAAVVAVDWFFKEHPQAACAADPLLQHARASSSNADRPPPLFHRSPTRRPIFLATLAAVSVGWSPPHAAPAARLLLAAAARARRLHCRSPPPAARRPPLP